MSFTLPLEFYISQWTSLPAAPQGDQLAGKIVILTGANSGIGLEVAHHMTALRPERLILAVRDPKTATEAFEAILNRAPQGVKVDLWQLDLGSFESVKGFAKQCQSLPEIDVLINNAGRNPGFSQMPIKRTTDGYEDIHQVNVLSQLLLVFLVHDLLVKSPFARVIFTSSEVHAWANTAPIVKSVNEHSSVFDWVEEEKQYVTATRYFQSKLLLHMVIRCLIPLVPYKIVAVNPGLCKSNLGRDFVHSSGFAALKTAIWRISTQRTAEVGARNVTHAVVHAKDSHEYWSDCEPRAEPSVFLASKTGMRATGLYWKEVKEHLERAEPGCTAWLKQ